VRQVAATETSVALAWSPSSDNVGVFENGHYASGLRLASVSDSNSTVANLRCGTGYVIELDAADAAGNRSTRSSASFSTSSCPSTNKPPSTPTGLKVTASTPTSVTLAWTASLDDVAVAGYGLYVGGNRIGQTTSTSADFPGLQCGTTYTFGVDAYDAPGKRSTLAEISAATAPCAPTPPPPPPPSSTGAVTQTIASGATLANVVGWRAVYDANGDNVEDDPGQMQFLVDGQVVLSEDLIPFGDSFAEGSITVPNGTHSFEVRALNDNGALLAKTTATATIATTTAGDTSAPTQPSNLRVTSAAATNVAVAWSPATDNVAVTGYGLYRSSNPTGQTPQTSATYSGLSCGTAYQVGVDAYDAANNHSAPANLAVSTTPCADSQAPTAPTNLTATARTTTSITLSWAPSTDNIGVAAYWIYKGAELVQTTAGTTAIVSGLDCGTSYTLAVDAFDAAGNASPKTATMVSTLACSDTTAPTQPTNLRLVSATPSGAAIAWNPSTDNVAVVGYDVFRAGTKVGTAATPAYTISGLTCGTTYSTGVKAVDAAGNASTQATLSVTTSPCAAPTGSYPDASNTGVPGGTALAAYTGPSTITTANTVIDGKSLGCIAVAATGVVIRNSRVSCSSGYAVFVRDNGAGSLLVEDSDITCNNSNATGVGEANVTLRRVDLSGCENGLDVNQNITVEDSYIHDLYNGGGAHMDGLQFASGHFTNGQLVTGVLNVTVRHNTIYALDPSGSFGTSALITDLPGHTNVLIENNLLAGGAYTLYCAEGTGINYRVINNHFSTRFKSTVGYYGPATQCSDDQQSGNVIHETGLPLSLG
jgi:chitodextrinase